MSVSCRRSNVCRTCSPACAVLQTATTNKQLNPGFMCFPFVCDSGAPLTWHAAHFRRVYSIVNANSSPPSGWSMNILNVK